MKKKISLLLLALSLSLTVGCTPKENLGNVAVSAQIVNYENDSMLVIGQDDFDVLCSFSTKDLELPADIKSGDIISFDYDGAIMESYPGQIGNIKNLEIAEAKADILGVYRKAIIEVSKCDPAVNLDTNCVVIDFSGVNNMNAEEKKALLYLLGSDLDESFNVYDSTSVEAKELADSALVYRLSNTETSEGFEFNVSKNKDAYVCGVDGKAIEKDNNYEVTFGMTYMS